MTKNIIGFIFLLAGILLSEHWFNWKMSIIICIFTVSHIIILHQDKMGSIKNNFFSDKELEKLYEYIEKRIKEK